MAYTTVNKSTDYFNTKLYTGDDTNNRQISLNFSPDLTWIKARNVAYGHTWYDRVRGIGKSISSSSSDSEYTNANGWSNSGCTTDSFTVDRGSNETLNESGRPMVAWNWKANGAGSSNSNGTIASTVSANTTAGFSIVKFTGNATSGATVGHGLGTAPAVIIYKNLNSSVNWIMYNKNLGNDNAIVLNSTGASFGAGDFADTTPSNTTFTLGGGGTINGSGNSIIAYCFAEKTGFSKFGSFIGNGNANGTFVYTGFKPAFVINKRIDSTGNWMLIDNKREGFNPDQDDLRPNLTNAEGSDETFDFLSNGFKVRTTSNDFGGGSGATYIFMAFAEEPLVGTNNVPATAR